MARRNKRNATAAVAAPSAGPAGQSYHVSDAGVLGAFAGMVSPPPGVRVPVTEANALTLSAVWACVRVISGAIGVAPLRIYERSGIDNERIVGDDIAPVKLARKPCPEMGPLSFWEVLVQHALLGGNGYAEIERDGRGNPVALWPLPPGQVRPFRDSEDAYRLKYEVWGNGYRVILPAHNVFHLAGLGFDGVLGYAVVRLAARPLTLTASAEQAGESYFGNGMKPGGWIEYPGTFQEMQKSNMLGELEKKNSGATAFGKALLLWGGGKFHPIDINPNDAQFLETRQFQVEEVCRWFRVPPHKVQHLLRATFSNIEHQGGEFVTDTLLYWTTKITDEFFAKLLESYGPQYFAEHDLSAFQRGDTISRYTAYGMGRQWGFLSPNDCRRKENLPPIDGGDVYHVPVNMAPMGSEPSRQPAPQPNLGVKAMAIRAAGEACFRDAQTLQATASAMSLPKAVRQDRPDIGYWQDVGRAVAPAVSAVAMLGGVPADTDGFARAYAARRCGLVADSIKADNQSAATLALAHSLLEYAEWEAIAALMVPADSTD